MEVVVSELLPDGEVRVAAAGHVWRGRWHGRQSPALGPVDVELDVVDELRWGPAPALLGAGDAENVVIGRVEDSDAAGTVTLRVGSGLLMCDVPDDGPLPRAGEALRLERVALAFFPTGI